MSKKPKNASSNSFVTKVDLSLADKLLAGLKDQGFEISKPQYTVFSGKKKGVSCTLYESGKLLVQGKEMGQFIEFFLEPEILQDFSYSYADLNLDKTARIGIDESGKGDFFGPLCVAGVFAQGDQIAELRAMGVKDSKNMTDKAIFKVAKKIKDACPWHVVRINPLKYNELYSKFRNLNYLLAWAHATAIEQLIQKTSCQNVIIDQFAAEHVVEGALAKKGIKPTLKQRPRAEEDLVVAAASILARAAFLEGLQRLEQQFDTPLPKGASSKVVDASKTFITKHGREQLPEVCKTHFKTYDVL